MKPYEIIQKLESDNSRLFKEEVILNTALHQYEFVSGAKLALDPYTTFGIKQILAYTFVNNNNKKIKNFI